VQGREWVPQRVIIPHGKKQRGRHKGINSASFWKVQKRKRKTGGGRLFNRRKIAQGSARGNKLGGLGTSSISRNNDRIEATNPEPSPVKKREGGVKQGKGDNFKGR